MFWKIYHAYLPFFFIAILPSTLAIGCIQFTQFGFCAKCDQGFRLDNGKCTPDIQNCQEYDEQFTCIGCLDGFAINNRNQCEKSSNSNQQISAAYTQLTSEQIQRVTILREIQDILQKQLGLIPLDAPLFGIYALFERPWMKYRVIYVLENGYAQVGVHHNPENGQLKFQKQIFFLEKPGQIKFELNQDPNVQNLKNQIFSQFPKLINQKLLASYRRGDGKTEMFRFLYFSNTQGILEAEVQISIQEKEQIQRLSSNEIQTNTKFQIGYQYLVNEYSDQLRGGSLQWLGINKVFGITYYIFRLKKEDDEFQFLYTLDEDEVKFVEFTIIDEKPQDPSISLFMDLTINQFESDGNSNAIIEFLMKERAQELAGSVLEKVQFFYSQNYFYYRILFKKGDVGYWKEVAYNFQSKAIVFISEQKTDIATPSTTFIDEFEAFPDLKQKKQEKKIPFEKKTLTAQELASDQQVNKIRTFLDRLYSKKIEAAALVEVIYESNEMGLQYYYTFINQSGKKIVFHVILLENGAIEVLNIEQTTLDTRPTVTVLTQEQYTTDNIFKFINGRLVILYRARLGDNVKIVEAIRRQFNGNFQYFITYSGSKGKFEFLIKVIDERNFDIMSLDKVQEEIQQQTKVQQETPQTKADENGKIALEPKNQAFEIEIQTKNEQESKTPKQTQTQTGKPQEEEVQIPKQTTTQQKKTAEPEQPKTQEVQETSRIISPRQYNTEEIQRMRRLIQALYRSKMGDAKLAKVVETKKGQNLFYLFTYEGGNIQYLYNIIKEPSGRIDVIDISRKQIQNTEKPQPPKVGAPEQLTTQQIANDEYMRQIDQQLRKQNDLDGFMMKMVTKQIVNGFLYKITYENANGGQFIFEVGVTFRGQIVIRNTQVRRPQRAVPQPVQKQPQTVKQVSQPMQEMTQPVQEMTQPVQEMPQPVQEMPQPVQEMPQTMRIVPQTVRIVPQPVSPPSPPPQYQFLPEFIENQAEAGQLTYEASDFEVLSPVLYEIFTNLIEGISIPQSSISYVVVNENKSLYKVMTGIGSWIYFIAPISQSVKIYQIYVQPEFPQLLGDVRLFDSQKDQIAQFVTKFERNDIQSIGGRLFFENHRLLAKGYIILTLLSGQTYAVEAIFGQSASSPLFLMGYSILPKKFTNYQFGQFQTVDSSKIMEIRSIFPQYQIRKIISVQIQNNSINIQRVIFTSGNFQKFEAIISGNKVISLRRVDEGYKVQLMPAQSGTTFEIKNLILNLMLIDGTLKMVKERTLGSIVDYIVIFESSKQTYEIRLIKQGRKWIVHQIRPLNSGLGQQSYSYKKFSESVPANIAEVVESRNFKVSQRHLLKHYSHFLKNPTIRDIFIFEDFENAVTTYNVIYVTRSSTFLAILRFNKKTEEPEIKSLVVAEQNEYIPYIEGCKTATESLKQCQECDEGLVLGSDSFCYLKVSNCEHFSGNTCYYCEEKYSLSENECKANCGILCDENHYNMVNSLPKTSRFN